jgi:hypothetical protein
VPQVPEHYFQAQQELQVAQVWALREPIRRAGGLAEELAADCLHRQPLDLLAEMVELRLELLLGRALGEEAQLVPQEDLQLMQQQIFPQLEARVAAADPALQAMQAQAEMVDCTEEQGAGEAQGLMALGTQAQAEVAQTGLWL